MGLKKKAMEIHDFYCPLCGQKTYSLSRVKSHQYEKHHRKKLYCPWCKIEVNCIECRNDSEVFEFKMAFENGEYTEEAQDSIEFIKQENLVWG